MRRLLRAALAVGAATAIWALMVPAPAAQPSIEEQFKYGSIGAEDQEGIPYWIWQVLPRVFADKLPPGGYGALGLIWEPDHDTPIGFAKKSVWGVQRVAINCAFCHTQRVRATASSAPAIVLAGASHQFDPQAYSRFLDATAADPRFDADTIMAEIGKLTRLGWIESAMYRYVMIPAVKKGLLEHRQNFTWMDSRPIWGFGRIDPQNPFKFTTLEQPIDDSIGNSDIMPIWNMKARRGMALHWDGMNTNYREVVLSSGLGNGATPKSLEVAVLDRLGAWFEEVQPPKFPFPIDAALAQQGNAIYANACGSCHAAGGARTGQVIPIGEVGTDRHRLDTWTAPAAEAFNALTRGQRWEFKGFRKTDGMATSLLDGIWLRGPYLHNGSVPTLADLLEPAAARPKTFFRGYDVVDPVKVGFVSHGPDAQAFGFAYDTSIPGNGNGGHEYGTGMTAEEKRALLEYLKTL